MKRFLMVLLVLLNYTSRAQDKATDSLKQVLRTEIADTTRLWSLLKLVDHYRYSNRDTFLILAQQSLAFSRQKGLIGGEAACLYTMGGFFLDIGNYPKSLDSYLRALKKYEFRHNRNGILRTYTCIGIVYGEMGDYPMEISYYRKSKTLAESIHDQISLNYILTDMGSAYEILNQLDSALIYTNQGYELAITLNNEGLKCTTLNNLGNIHSKMQQGEIAMGYYRQSLSMETEMKDFISLCETTLGMAALFKNAGQADSALFYARLSYATANKGGFTKRILNASTFLSTCFRELNQIDSAYYYQGITIAAKDSLFSQEKVLEVQNLGFMEKIRQQEIVEAERLAKEERKSNMQLIGIVAFISFLFALLFVFSKRHVNPAIIKFLGLLGLLLLFEFISLFLHPYIANFTHHKPILMLLILVAIASILVPTQHKLQGWVKERLAQKQMNALTIVSDNVLTE